MKNLKIRPPSLRDFDYFAGGGADHPHDPHLQSQSDPSSDESAQSSCVAPRQIVSLVLTAAFLAVSGWFSWQFRDCAAYAFAPAQEPLRLGNVSEMTPDDVPHNAYVSVHGITEHRGLYARAVRGLSLKHDEFWYFRLMGSRGVFIEVTPNAEMFGPNTEVTVQGRAVDPDADPLYAALLKSYESTFATELRAHRRVIQVGFAPGTGRARYIFAIAMLLGCAGIFSYNGWRVLRQLWR